MKGPPLAQGKEWIQPVRLESRWPVVFAIITVLFLLASLRSRTRLFPNWLAYAIGMALILPMAGVWLSGARTWWLRLERVTMLCGSVIVELITLATLFYLVLKMMNQPMVLSGRQLLTS